LDFRRKAGGSLLNSDRHKKEKDHLWVFLVFKITKTARNHLDMLYGRIFWLFLAVLGYFQDAFAFSHNCLTIFVHDVSFFTQGGNRLRSPLNSDLFRPMPLPPCFDLVVFGVGWVINNTGGNRRQTAAIYMETLIGG
jgi:hypothetical protein